ncbi:hypothetical protein HPB50_004845 [Hyalomma asiaticum]|uniref:Uncharacterized protein n=1 Tax=Hyalomma asiaticum TaxID=266040 RepID=A0ACB7SE17_HYAAI|nr:hypothetical protein HPB50_004845 [Hyalomma asiaticum]
MPLHQSRLRALHAPSQLHRLPIPPFNAARTSSQRARSGRRKKSRVLRYAPRLSSIYEEPDVEATSAQWLHTFPEHAGERCHTTTVLRSSRDMEGIQRRPAMLCRRTLACSVLIGATIVFLLGLTSVWLTVFEYFGPGNTPSIVMALMTLVVAMAVVFPLCVCCGLGFSKCCATASLPPGIHVV